MCSGFDNHDPNLVHTSCQRILCGNSVLGDMPLCSTTCHFNKNFLLCCFSHQQKCAEKKRDMEKGFRERLSDTKNSAIVTNLLLSGTFFESDILATGSLDSAISVLKTYRNFSQCCGSSTLRSPCSTRNPRGPTTSNAGRSLFLLRKRGSREQRGGDIFSPPILQNYIRLFKCIYHF